ncbi:MAG: class I SAM-dependent methyltransferase [Bacteroidales bacterium]|nr:class I SAM-dependent methyltransferase [Bacteroidales bacterium]
MKETRYTFGDTITANERLKRIAAFFNPLAASFIREHVHTTITSVADLGCGPGYTTDMLAHATNARYVTGLDISENFLDAARQNFTAYTFIYHDVRDTNLPVKTDLVYFRFLLSHLKNIRQLVEDWTASLNPSGYIVIDELEDIYTDNKFFKDYLSVSDGLIKSQGADLYIGKKLNEELDGLNIFKNVSSLLPVKDSQAAEWFYPNTISVWKDEPWVKDRLCPSEINCISQYLLKTSINKTEKSSITWRMKKMIIRARDTKN